MGHVCIVHVDHAVADSSSLVCFDNHINVCHACRSCSCRFLFPFFFPNHINVGDVSVIHIDCSVADSSSFFFLFFFLYLFWFVAKHISVGLLFERTIISPLQNPNENYFALSLMCQPNV